MYKKIPIIVFFVVIVGNVTFAQVFNNRIPYRLKNKWGICDTSLKVIVKPIYDAVGIGVYCPFLKTELSKVKLLDKYGFLNNEGKIIIKPIYDKVILPQLLPNEYKINGVFVKKNGKYGFCDFNNLIKIPCNYDTLYLINTFKNNQYEYKIIAKQNKSLFTFSKTFAISNITENQLKEINVGNELEGVGVHNLEYPRDEAQLLEKLNESINAYGRQFDSIRLAKINGSQFFKFYNKGKFFVQNVNQLNDFWPGSVNMDTSNVHFIDEILEIKYDCYLIKRNGLIGIMNNNLQLLLPFKYNAFKSWNTWLMYFKQNNKVGVYHFYKEKELLPAIYDDIEEVPYQDYTLWKVKKNGKIGYINSEQKEFFKD